MKLQKLKNRLSRLIPAIKARRKLFVVVLSSVVLVLLLFFVNRSLFSSRISSLNNTTEEIISAIDSSDTILLNAEQQTKIEKYSKDLSVGYPESLGNLAYLLSSKDKNTISQIYKLSDSSRLYIDTLYRLPEITAIINNTPLKESLTDNPTLFINSYNNSISDLEKFEEALDVDVLMKIFVSIRDSAELYVANDRFDLFEARYDNIYSELDKEYQKSIEVFREDVINELNSLQRLIEKL